jgi:MFS family permease
LHYAWIVAAITFLVLLVTAAVRATPGVLMVPLTEEFGWSTAAISVAIAINIALFGLIGPFAASLMDRLGVRRLILCALALLTFRTDRSVCGFTHGSPGRPSTDFVCACSPDFVGNADDANECPMASDIPLGFVCWNGDGRNIYGSRSGRYEPMV